MQTSTYPSATGNAAIPSTSGKDAMKDFASSTPPQAAVERLGAVAGKAAQSVREIVDEGKAVAAERFDAGAEWVGTVTRENPMRTLGVVAAVGVVIGLLLGRR
jgi:ElaB/YqjD/DUF883 family membrane-anchored ribosome-binding protein